MYAHKVQQNQVSNITVYDKVIMFRLKKGSLSFHISLNNTLHGDDRNKKKKKPWKKYSFNDLSLNLKHVTR